MSPHHTLAVNDNSTVGTLELPAEDAENFVLPNATTPPHDVNALVRRWIDQWKEDLEAGWSDDSEEPTQPTPEAKPTALKVPLRKNDTIIGTALWAYYNGFFPVPIHPIDSPGQSPGKRPIGADWGAKRSDPGRLNWFNRKFPGMNLGLKLGAEGRIIDIDVDDPETAGPTLARIFPEGIPPTLGWSNAGGKFHLLFWWDDRLARHGKAIIKGQIKDGKVIGNPHYLGLEIRIGAASGDGKQYQTVIPPSRMGDGQPRRWYDNPEILPVPDCLIADLDRHAGAIEVPEVAPAKPKGKGRKGATQGGVTAAKLDQRIKAWMDTKEPGIQGSNGSDPTFDAAVDLVQGWDLGIDGARPYLREYSAGCVPPWSDDELEHKLEDADKLIDSQGRPRGWIRDAPRTDVRTGPGGATQEGTVGDLQFAMTDLGNARRLAFLHGHEIRYCSVLKCWHVYQLGRWAKDRSLCVEQMARDVVAMIELEANARQKDLKSQSEAKTIDENAAKAEQEAIDALRAWAFRSQSARAIRDMIQLAQSEEGIPVTPEEFDRHPWLLNFRNGTLNLRDDSFEFRDHDPADMLSMQTACDYVASASCPRFDEAMRQITAQDADYEAYLDRTIGASLTGQPSEQEFYMPFGKGRNGKNIWLDLNREALGDYGREAEPSLLMASKNDKHPTGLADLSGARLVTLGETEDGKAFAEAFLKRITGNTTLKARLMHKDFFGFGRSFTIFLATNYEPEIKGKDHAIWERIKVLPFPVTFVDDESEVKPPHKLLKDRRLMDTLRAEFSGILNRAIRACREWQRGGMRPPRNVAGAVSDYRERMDHAQQFVEACFERFPKDDPKARVETKAIYQAYYFWCEHNEAEAESPRVLGSSLESLGHTIQKSNGKSYRRFLKVKPPEEPAQSEQVDQK